MKRIITFILACALVFGLTACGGNKKNVKIKWNDIILGEIIPEPPKNNGEIHFNDEEKMWIDINEISTKQKIEYIQKCKEKGFTIDVESDEFGYVAYNDVGYQLEIRHYKDGDEMVIELKKPMEMSTIVWPNGIAGKKLPVPKSNIGNFNYEYEDHFSVYVGNTSKDEYNAYVKECINHGFTVDYSKGDNYYSAENSEGWDLDVKYEGNNIMLIYIDCPDETTTTKATTTATTVKKPSSIDPDFKAAMDSYEKFMDEYVAFIKKYEANPTDVKLLSAYADYMGKYTKCVSDFEKWDDEDLNDAELNYYIQVQGRVTHKLASVAY